MIALVQLITAQTKVPDVDKSPMDMSYCPPSYPILKMNGKTKDGPIGRVIYSRPMKNNRVVFGGIVKYNTLWRLGANETTEIHLNKDIKINGKKLAKGSYSMFCIPQESKWTIIFNKELNTWGDFLYDKNKDAMRVDVNTETLDTSVEAFSMFFETTTKGYNLIMEWDTVKVSLPITL